MPFRIDFYAKKGFQVFFSLFLFFSVIFCGYTRVNNLFHLSFLCFMGILLGDPVLLHQLFANRQFNIGLSLTVLMLGYFCLTTLWSSYPGNLISHFTHSIYLLLFIIMYRLTVLQGSRLIILCSAASGILLLVFLTFFSINIKLILSNRIENGFFGAPSNVIDLAGYFVLGIFIFLIIARDTGAYWLYFPVTVLFIAILLTQSRGPLLAFIFSLGVLLILELFLLRKWWNPLAVSLISIIVLLLLFIIFFSNTFLQRMLSVYQQSFIRFDIWHHTINLAAKKLFFGWGLEQQLSFVNLLGDSVTTTHSLYLSALLKGGIFGLLLLLLVIIYGFVVAKRQCAYYRCLEGALFLFSSSFYLTQGMFIISNPTVSWNIFWLPLAVVLNTPEGFSPQYRFF